MEQQEQIETVPVEAKTRSVLLRKVHAGNEVRQTRAMSLAKALRLTLAKVADDLHDFAMAVIGVRSEIRGTEELVGLFDIAQLLVLVDGPNRSRGAIVFDRALVGALLQQQTMGKVLPVLEGDDRRMTATDAAVCVPFIDALFSRVAPLPDEAGEKALVEGYRFGAQVSDPRLLIMALEAPTYEVIHLTVDVAGGTRQGTIVLCLPHKPVYVDNVVDDKEKADRDPPKKKEVKLGEVVMGLTAELKIVLAQIRMPVGTLQSLKHDDVFELGISAFNETTLMTIDGRKVGKGTLGQLNGMRAVQVEHTVNATNAPRRRISDRDGLNLPKVTGNGLGIRDVASETKDRRVADQNEQLHEVVEGAPDTPSQPMKGFEDVMEPLDMPDMSDLPGLGIEDTPPQVEAG